MLERRRLTYALLGLLLFFNVASSTVNYPLSDTGTYRLSDVSLEYGCADALIPVQQWNCDRQDLVDDVIRRVKDLR